MWWVPVLIAAGFVAFILLALKLAGGDMAYWEERERKWEEEQRRLHRRG